MEEVMRVFALGLAGMVSLAAVTAAQAGNECYRRVVDPAQYRTVEESVMVAPERQAPEYIPAVTREVEETVVVEPAREITHVIPAEYGVQEETVMVSPGGRQWQTRQTYSGVVGCWVDVPPTYARQARRVLVRPAQTVSETVPLVIATSERTEIVEPAHTVYHVVPARYATRERTELVAPEGAHWAPLQDSCYSAQGGY
jgi:hypothetical protein